MYNIVGFNESDVVRARIFTGNAKNGRFSACAVKLQLEIGVSAVKLQKKLAFLLLIPERYVI